MMKLRIFVMFPVHVLLLSFSVKFRKILCTMDVHWCDSYLLSTKWIIAVPGNAIDNAVGTEV